MIHKSSTSVEVAKFQLANIGLWVQHSQLPFIGI